MEQREQAERDATARRKSQVKIVEPEKSNNFSLVDADGDGKITRDEWRIWADNEIKFLKEANKERVKIIQENRRLRAALSKPSTAKQEEQLIQQDLELSELSELIAQAQLTKSTLEAELKVFGG